MLISLEKIATTAVERGFKVNRLMVLGHGACTVQLEISEPAHNDGGLRGFGGEVYSTAQFIVDDGPLFINYGYNPFFKGPYHNGFAQSGAYGLGKLLEHPLMSGVTF